jgi:hypothetical protein
MLAQNNFSGMGDISRDPIGPGIRFTGSVSGLDEDCPDAGIAAAPNVAGFVAHQERAAQLKVMIALRFEDHARTRFAPDRV